MDQYEPFPYGADPQYGQIPPNDQHPYGQMPYGPPPMTTMPGTVRAAQVISFIFGGLGLGVTILLGVLVGPEAAGGAIAGFLFAIILALLAFGFGSSGNGLRVTAIVVASIEALLSVGGMASKLPPGLLGFVASVAVIVTLAQGSSAAWFKRFR